MATATGRIFKQADRQGGDACVHGTRIPVWVLDNCRRLGMPDAQILSTYPSLTPPDLEAAWDYVAANREEIEQAIRENEEGERRPRIAGFRSSGTGQSDRRKACEPISWPMVLPRESAAVSLKYRRWDLNPHALARTGF